MVRKTFGSPNWAEINGRPMVVVSPNGPDDGGDYGPNTARTTTAGIQEAINAVGTATGGGTVRIKAGTYTISTGITDGGYTDVKVEGEGTQTTIGVVAGSIFHIINIIKNRWAVMDLHINGANQARGNLKAGVNVTSASTHGLIENCFIENTDHGGIDCTGTDWRVLGNHLLNTDDNINVRGTGMLVSNNVCDTTVNNNNISLVGALDCLVVGNVCRNSGNCGIAIENVGGVSCLRCNVVGNHVYNSAQRGIRVFSQTGGVNGGDYCNISNNVVDTTGTSVNIYAISIDSGNYIKVSGNEVYNAGTDAIVINGVNAQMVGSEVVGNLIAAPLGRGIVVQNVRDCLVNGNFVAGTASGSPGIQLISGAQLSVINNMVYNSGGKGIHASVGGATSEVQICRNTIDSPADNCIHAAANLNHLQVSDNLLLNPTGGSLRGIELAGSLYFQINGNKFYQSVTPSTSGHGILVRNAGSTMQAGTIANNVIVGNAVNASGIYILTTVLDTVVQGNYVDGFTNAINEGSGSDYNMILNNNVRNNNSNKIILTGAHTIVRGNLGFNPVASVTTPSIATGPTTNTTGLIVEVIVNIGAVATTVSKNGTAISSAIATADISVILNPNDTITLSQVTSVTWTWWDVGA